MQLDIERVKRLVRAGELGALFAEELGWDRHRDGLDAPLDGHTYVLRAVAQKRGMVAWACGPGPDGRIPDSATRAKLDRQVAKRTYEHLVVYADAAGATQTWEWVKREPGRPPARREHTVRFDAPGNQLTLLVEKLDRIKVALEEEEGLTLPDVTSRVRAAFNPDRLTKRFYDRFQTEHTSFLGFIEGITAQGDREWYASLMLNRLMFVYFLQRKEQGFLDGDRDYLRNRLQQMRALRGGGEFHNFYRYFLLKLFHDGLGQQAEARTPEVRRLLGRIPYLNGGLFDVHELERANPEIEIADEAFERVFDFFDEWNWHLDERPLATPNEINPDVLGYIFEKYINQKQMGAYYTKEDITEYISKSTIIPFLFDAAREKDRVAFEPGSALWRLLSEDPDRYIYEAVRKGMDRPLPDEIATGVVDVAARGGWNRPAAEGYALPTETWREHVARRSRYEEVRERLARGDVHEVDDLVTLNLDIRQLAQDAIQWAEGPDVVRAFYKAIRGVTVLDPTCGSGAFLFAALGVLEPLYEACLERMAGFVADADRSGDPRVATRYADFRATLAQVARHPSRRYYILKSIILNNLYGVDIMEEAVEICKLRLFLKLVAQVERVEDVEPLPDIDFNVRAGNTLVGFATREDVRRAAQSRMDFGGALAEIEERAEIAGRAFRQFHEMQAERGMDAEAFRDAKATVRDRLHALNARLDRYLASEYGIAEADDPAGYGERFDAWRESHRPFHWFVDFYEIMQRGGFDVVIGNPPYVEYSKVRAEYSVTGFDTLPCGNLYAFVVERSTDLSNTNGRTGLIVPLSLVCTSRMGPLRQLLSNNSWWISSYDMRPSSLFEGVSQRLSILLAVNRDGKRSRKYTGGYRRWSSSERAHLVSVTSYTDGAVNLDSRDAIAKYSVAVERELEAKIAGPSIARCYESSAEPIFVHRIVRYFVKALDFIPLFVDPQGATGKSEDYKEFRFARSERPIIVAMLDSSLFYWFWRTHSDGFHCGYGDVELLPFREFRDQRTRTEMTHLEERLMIELRHSATEKRISTKAGRITFQEFSPKATKPIIDEIDRVLARHYGFTEEELDYIINYDIKYRMGRGGGEGE